jgi:hypothetical protein
LNFKHEYCLKWILLKLVRIEKGYAEENFSTDKSLVFLEAFVTPPCLPWWGGATGMAVLAVWVELEAKNHSGENL